MEINLNQRCTVILLARGVEAIRKYYTDLRFAPMETYSVGSEFKGQLWEIMYIFGGYLNRGPEPPFETMFKIKPQRVGDKPRGS